MDIQEEFGHSYMILRKDYTEYIQKDNHHYSLDSYYKYYNYRKYHPYTSGKQLYSLFDIHLYTQMYNHYNEYSQYNNYYHILCKFDTRARDRPRF